MSLCGLGEPRVAAAEDEVGGLDELPHDGDEGHLLGLSTARSSLRSATGPPCPHAGKEIRPGIPFAHSY